MIFKASAALGTGVALLGGFLFFYFYDTSGLGAFCSGIVVSFNVWLIAHFYTRQREKLEATFRFSDQFQKLLDAQHRLNHRFKYVQDNKGYRTIPDDQKAWNFYRQYFNLLLQEFNFLRRGLLDKATMFEWMTWIWFRWNPCKVPKDTQFLSNEMLDADSDVCGVSLQQGWDWWRNRPAANKEFREFMEQIYRAETLSDVKRVVQNVRRRIW